MPNIDSFKCDNCDFTLPSGWDGYTYVKDNSGKKIICPHPGESDTIAEVLGLDDNDIGGFPWLPPQDEAMQKLLMEKTGFNSHCVCLNCLNKFDLDVMKEERICPECNLKTVKTELEMVGQQCPKCKEGTIRKLWTGIIS